MKTKSVSMRVKSNNNQPKNKQKPKLYGILKGDKVSSKKEVYLDMVSHLI